MSATIASVPSWGDAWFRGEGTIYLNAAGQAPMPRVALEAVQASLEWKKFPYLITDRIELNLPDRVRDSLASIAGTEAQNIALSTGASAGLSTLACGLEWKPGDEVLTARGEFPVQYAVWKPMEKREGIKLRLVAPQGRWISADDFIAAMTPRTRVVSASLVRFEDGSRLDAAKLAAACHQQGCLLALDVSQYCGAIPMSVAALGADFLTCSGYKWLLGPYGTGFFWASKELLSRFRPMPFYWQGIAGLENFDSLIFENPEPARGARSLDAAETASHFNLSGWDASLKFLREVGVETVAAHNLHLMSHLMENLPKDRCEWTSPLEPERRGPYGCFAGRSAEDTRAMFERLKKEGFRPSQREGNIRVSTHLYNSEAEIDKLVRVISE